MSKRLLVLLMLGAVAMGTAACSPSRADDCNDRDYLPALPLPALY